MIVFKRKNCNKALSRILCIRDLNRGIEWIKYNCLHLPSTIQFSNGNKSSYAYDATGMKRSVQHAFSLSGIQIPFGGLYPINCVNDNARKTFQI